MNSEDKKEKDLVEVNKTSETRYLNKIKEGSSYTNEGEKIAGYSNEGYEEKDEGKN